MFLFILTVLRESGGSVSKQQKHASAHTWRNREKLKLVSVLRPHHPVRGPRGLRILLRAGGAASAVRWWWRLVVLRWWWLGPDPGPGRWGRVGGDGGPPPGHLRPRLDRVPRDPPLAR